MTSYPPHRFSSSTLRALLALLAIATCANTAKGQTTTLITLHDPAWSVQIDTATLSAKGELPSGVSLPISGGSLEFGGAIHLTNTSNTAQWDLPTAGLHIAASMKEGRLFFEISSEKAQKITWPIVASTESMRGIILPRGEGFYIPVREKRWQDFATGLSPIHTMEDLTMPLLGVDYGGSSLTYVLNNPIDSALKLEQQGTGLGFSMNHDFQANYAEKKYGFVIMPGGDSPIEPALLYRKWLIKTGQFVSLKEKLRTVPDLERLFGAAHVYLWADGILDGSDIHGWPALANALRNPSTPAAMRVASLLPTEIREGLASSKNEQFPSRYTKQLIVTGLNAVINTPTLYKSELWPMASLPVDIQPIAKAGSVTTISESVAKLNSCLLSTTFSGSLGDCHSFGGGISPKMVGRLQQAGLDRLLLLVPDLDTLTLMPETVTAAKQAGYLFGTYDSYHSIHPPGAKNTWATAQFDQKLFDTGAIIRSNGQRHVGFQGIGAHLSSIAAEPYMEKRIDGWMSQFKFNAYFIDCDATGELFDNYSKTYPATKQLDMQLRLDRLKWIIDNHHVVLGSEIGASFSAPIIHFGHGIMTPVFGWGDPVLRDKASPYFVGGYYPSAGPDMFFKQTPLPDKYKDTYFNPLDRIPLYEAAFRDSIITTHHWSLPSTKFANTLEINELLELLYGVPPLYHLDIAELDKRKQEIQTHQAFFSTNYRKLALSPLSDFAWLTKDHLVQKVEFGEEATAIANFGTTSYSYQNHTVMRASVLLIWKSTGKTATYKSQYPQDVLPD